jgi:hypothetical protein
MVGCGDKSDDGTGDNTDSGDTTSGTDTGTTETDTTTGSTGSGATTTGDATTTPGQSDTGPPSPCDLACEVFLECDDAYASLDECVTGCEAQFEPGGQSAEPGCREATEAWLLCVAGLDCEQYAEMLEGDVNDPGPYPCKDEETGIRDACYDVNTSSS